jgi:hypothetical protein
MTTHLDIRQGFAQFRILFLQLSHRCHACLARTHPTTSPSSC